MNRVELVGGLTRDPEFRVTASGVSTWFATIAVNGARYDSTAREQVVKTVYVSLSAFGWMAEQLYDSGYSKGDELHVVGELDQYEVDGADGKKDRKTRVSPQVVTATRRRPAPAPTQQPAADPWGPTREPPF